MRGRDRLLPVWPRVRRSQPGRADRHDESCSCSWGASSCNRIDTDVDLFLSVRCARRFRFTAKPSAPTPGFARHCREPTADDGAAVTARLDDLLLRRARGGAARQLPRVHRAALPRRPRSTARRERRVGGVHQVPRVRARGTLRRLRRRSSPRGVGRRGHRGPSAVERTRDGDDAVLLGRQRPVPAGAARGRCEGLPPLARRLRRRRTGAAGSDRRSRAVSRHGGSRRGAAVGAGGGVLRCVPAGRGVRPGTAAAPRPVLRSVLGGVRGDGSRARAPRRVRGRAGPGARHASPQESHEGGARRAQPRVRVARPELPDRGRIARSSAVVCRKTRCNVSDPRRCTPPAARSRS